MKNKKLLFIFVILIITLFVSCVFFNKVEIDSKKMSREQFKNIEEIIIDKIENEEEISLDNCDYKYSDVGNLILRDYVGYAEGVRIPDSLNGKKVESIECNMFEYDNNLEVIRVPKKIAESIDKIDNFKINKELSNEEYVVYVTNKTYNNEYLEYIKLSDSEKAEYEVIPSKFITTLEEYIQNEKNTSISNNLLRRIDTGNTIPDKYDLREHINVSVHNQIGGICYACASLVPVETNISLKNNVQKKFSEAHLAVVSGYGYGGHFVDDVHSYYSLGHGPIDYSDWSTETITENRETDPICDTVYKIMVNNIVTDEEKNEAITKMKESIPDYYVLKTTTLPTIQEAKQDYLKNIEEIQDVRNIIKQHIINNGALYTSVFPGYIKENGDGQICLYNKNVTFTGHAVAIIGWDDTFSRSNFDPDLPPPPCDGAWLCLDSDGIRASGTEYFWASYADYTIEANLSGVLSVHEGKVNLNECDISLSDENIDYNGMEQRPDVSFKFEGYTFTNGIDYTVEYRNNVEPGIATAVIAGINRFTGTTEKNFNIKSDSTIDTIPPILNVSYSTEEPTNGTVIVTITANEEIQELSGWTLSNDKKVLTKEYIENKEESVTVKDEAGNETTVNIKITNIEAAVDIDTAPPALNVSYSTEEPTNGTVIVTITANEEIQELSGWTLSNDKKVLTKEYTENKEESVTVKDEAGNETTVNIKITNIEAAVDIDTAPPTLNVSYNIIDYGLKRIIVTISSDEELESINGWTISSDKKSLAKVYSINIEEDIIVKDIHGNESIANIRISNISNHKMPIFIEMTSIKSAL